MQLRGPRADPLPERTSSPHSPLPGASGTRARAWTDRRPRREPQQRNPVRSSFAPHLTGHRDLTPWMQGIAIPLRSRLQSPVEIVSITCVETAPYRLPDDCALFEGGPLHPLWKRLGFVTPGPRLVDVRTVLIPLVAWLPLLVCSVWEGRAWSGATVPFFLDFEVQARLL